MIKLPDKCKSIISGLSFTGVLLMGFILYFPYQGCCAVLNKTSDGKSVCPARFTVPGKVRQLVVVQYKKNSKGRMILYQRDKEGRWVQSFSCTAWLGKRGIGKKKEGDKKTPVGFYYLEQPFGIRKDPGMNKGWHYLKISRRHYWCAASKGKYKKYYNQLVTSGSKVPGEHLIDYKGSYDYGMFITYNKVGKVGKGSAIFLHCSRNRPTAGCVAIRKKYMVKLMRKLKPDYHPGIVIY